jgi:hypothetical protein
LNDASNQARKLTREISKVKDATLWGEDEVWETVAYPMRPVATKARNFAKDILPSRACRSEARAVVGKKQRPEISTSF